MQQMQLLMPQTPHASASTCPSTPSEAALSGSNDNNARFKFAPWVDMEPRKSILESLPSLKATSQKGDGDEQQPQ